MSRRDCAVRLARFTPLPARDGAPRHGPARRTARIAGALLAVSIGVAACGDEAPDRWYSDEQVRHGEVLYANTCAECHGPRAEGADTWRQRDEAGDLPAPPLNGTAHAWHHPLDELRAIVRHGQNRMPAFRDTLTDEEVDAVIAWFQSHWNDEIYEAWLEYDARGYPGHDANDS